MSIFQRILVFIFYTIGVLLIAVPFFMASIIAVLTYPFVVIAGDILAAFGLRKR